MGPIPSVILLLLAAALAGCDDSSTGDGTPPETAVFHFMMRGDATGVQDFRAETSDAAVIEAVRAELALPEHERLRFISGPIERGNGGNLGWDWHFRPGAWELVEASIELCDGNAELVNQDLDYWVDTVGQFCPWGAYVAQEVTDSP